MISLGKKLVLAAALFVFAASAFAQLQLPRVSQKATVMQTVGLTDVTITYSRPGVKGRTVWGDLVPWDKPWRTGANEATKFTVTDDVTIEGQKLPAGTYALITIPGKDEWAIAFNKDADQWGAFNYDPAKDALKVKVKPQMTADSQEWMQFSFPVVTPDSATVELRWEKMRVPFTIGADPTEKALKAAREAVAKSTNDWRVPYSAASFAFNAKGADKTEAMAWVDKSIAAKETLYNLSLKADMLARDGKNAEAVATMEKAMAAGKASNEPADEMEVMQKKLDGMKAAKK